MRLIFRINSCLIMRKIYHFIVRFLCVVGSVQTIGLTTRAKIPKKYTSLSKFPDWSAQLFNKNIIYLILLIGFFLNNQIQVFGQANRFELGIEVFPNISSLNGTEYKNGFYEPILNFGSGVFFQYNIRKHFALRTNIAYERKGSIIKYEASDINGNPIDGDFFASSNFDYATIPLLFRFRFGDRINYFINSGPYFGYLIQQVYKNNLFSTTPQSVEGTFLHKKIDLGYTIGLGFSLPVNSKFGVSLELRNNLGLYNVSDMPPPYFESFTKTRSLNFILGLNYFLDHNNTRTK